MKEKIKTVATFFVVGLFAGIYLTSYPTIAQPKKSSLSTQTNDPGKEMLKNAHFARFSSHYFRTADGVKLHYIHKGSGKPLIMVNGWSGTAKDFAMNAVPLSEHFSVYILELRGHGYSDAPKYGARISRLSADVHEFFTSLNIKKASFMGFSMGPAYFEVT